MLLQIVKLLIPPMLAMYGFPAKQVDPDIPVEIHGVYRGCFLKVNGPEFIELPFA